MESRKALLGRLLAEVDTIEPVLIVGGGINGVGLLRDLALQGVPALLVEKGDFSSGTSAAPSRLIHGGLRYLETGEFALVRESVIERNHLLRNAAHLVKPIPVWVPAFSWFGGLMSAGLRFLKLKKTPGPKGIIAVKIGLMFFDRFGRKNKSMPDHRILSRRERVRRLPGLSPNVRAVAEYYDARLKHPERLVLELIKDAERDCPQSMALNYVSLQAGADGKVILKDGIDGQEIAIRPKMIVNCAGAWVDEVNRRLGIEQRLIGGTRGSHLVLRRPDLARQLADGMLYFETSDFRACLIYALDDELVLIGTTDIRTDEADNPHCSEEEIDYLFGVMNEVLPGSAMKRTEIVFAYAGIRPLPYSDDKTTGAISRDHFLKVFEAGGPSPYPVLALVGGKWTTYRACSEQISDDILKRLGKPRLRSTLDEKIGGGRNFDEANAKTGTYAADIVMATGIDRQRADIFVARYGSQANAVAQRVASGQTGLVGADGHFLEGEIRWILEEERVEHLSDIVLRRTLMPFENCLTVELIEAIAGIAAQHLGWDQTRKDAEIDALIGLLAQRYRVNLVR